MVSQFVKGAVIGAVTSSVLLISTAAVAGTGVGAVFNLGKTNKVDAQSTLTGTTSGKNLQITNSGSGPALGLTVGAGEPPLVVNANAGKATHLNADQLDGKDSTAFVGGRGHFLSNRATVTHLVQPGASASGTILTIPGFGEITGTCAGMFSGGQGAAYQFAFTNSSGQDLDLAFGGEPTPTLPSSDNGYTFTSYAGMYADVVLADGSTQVLAAPAGVPSSGSSLSPDFDDSGRFWIEAGRDTDSAHRIFDVSIVALASTSTPTCVFSTIGASHP
jgi:hypothetical protein